MASRRKNSRRSPAKQAPPTPTETDASVAKPPRWKWAFWVVVVLALVAVSAWSLCNRWFDQGLAAARVHQFTLAEQLLKRSGMINGRSGQVALLRSRVAWVSGDLQTAQTLLETAQQQGLDQKQIEQERLLITIRSGAAATEMRSQLPTMLTGTSTQDGPAILEAFTAGFLARGRIDQATEILRIWENADASDPRIHHWRGVLQQAFGHPNRAIEQFEKTIAVAPEMDQSRLALAETLRSAEFFAQAIPQYKQLVDAHPANSDAKRGLAICQIRTGNTEDGVRGLSAFVAGHPEDVSSRLVLAHHFQEAGQADKTLETLKPMVDRKSIDISLEYLLAAAYAHLGQRDKSNQHFDAFQRLNRQWSMAQMGIKRYELDPSRELANQIAVALLESRWQESGVWIMTALSQDPSSEKLNRMMADYLRRTGKDAAAASYEKIADDLAD